LWHKKWFKGLPKGSLFFLPHPPEACLPAGRPNAKTLEKELFLSMGG